MKTRVYIDRDIDRAAKRSGRAAGTNITLNIGRIISYVKTNNC